MTIDTARCYRYSLPLRAPLTVGGETLTERRGTLLRLRDEEGRTGWGEAAPLPGFSRESETTVRTQLIEVASRLSGASVPTREEGLSPDGLSATSLTPSVRFAVEGAVAELRAPAGEAPGLFSRRRPTVALNALVTETEEEAVEREGRRLRRAGYRAVKLKVGRSSVGRDVRRVHALRRGLGPDVALRLDANRAWTFDRALDFARGVEGVSIRYIEEPLRAPERLPAFSDETGMPVALDETTREHSPETLPDVGPVRAVVLKPTLIGGLEAARRWARTAQALEATPVVSAAYESGVGHRVLVALAASLSDAPAGLSTYERLEEDVLHPRLVLDGPVIELVDLYEGEVIPSRLTEIGRSA